MINRAKRKNLKEAISSGSLRVIALSSLLMASILFSSYKSRPSCSLGDYEAKRLIDQYERAAKENNNNSINRSRHKMGELMRGDYLSISDKYKSQIERILDRQTER